jgi:hypothetical protein
MATLRQEIARLQERAEALRKAHIAEGYRSPGSQLAPYMTCLLCKGNWDVDESEWHPKLDCPARPLAG